MKLLIVGASHVRAFLDAVLENPGVPLHGERIEPMVVGLTKGDMPELPPAPAAPRQPLASTCRIDVDGYCQRLIPLMDSVDHVLLLWDGGGHTRLSWAGGPKFDVVIPGGSAPSPEAMLVPYSALEEWIAGTFENPAPGMVFSTFWDAVSSHEESRKIVFLAPPPPLPGYTLRERLASLPGMVERARQLNLDVRDLPLAREELRRKVWDVLQHVYQRTAERCGRRLIPPPEEAHGPDGMLAPTFWGTDVQHANGRYAWLYLDKVVEALKRSEEEAIAPV